MKKILLALSIIMISMTTYAEWTTYQHPDGSSTTFGPNGSEYQTYQNPDGSSTTFGGSGWN